MSATDEISKLLMDDSDEKFFISWMVVNQAIEQGDCTSAHDLLEEPPRFANDTFGKEAVARMAMMSGDDARAAEIYSSIEAESTEGRMFLARRAYNHQQWDEALRLTKSLLEQHPNSKVLNDFLHAIEAAAAKK